MNRRVIVFLFVLLCFNLALVATTQISYAASEDNGCGWTNLTGCVKDVIDSIGSWVLDKFLGIFVWFASTVAGLFETILNFSVFDFGSFYNTYLKKGVEGVWVVFRDVSNIVIIGSFIFVAILTILGSTTYGARQFIVKLLIAATLINFSLFFTKIAIDVSNVFALQFRTAINYAVLGAAPANDPQQQVGVADALFHVMKFSSTERGTIFNTNNFNLGEQMMFSIFGIITSILLLVVLGYGAFLLISRVVILIVLLLTSSLAFATIALPGMDSWFKQWKSTLIINVLFAPLLLLFLWATIMVAQGLTNAQIAVVADPGSPNMAGVTSILISQLIIIGLLLSSFMIAKKASIGGVKMMGAGKLPDMNWKTFQKLASGTGNSLNYLRSRVATNRLQGRTGARLQDELRTLKADQASGKKLTTLERTRMDSLESKLARMKKTSEGKFGFAETGIGNGYASVQKVFKEGAGKGGYAKVADASKKEAEKKVAEEYKNMGAVTEREKKEVYEKEVGKKMQIQSDRTAMPDLQKQKAQLEEEVAEIKMKTLTGTTPEQIESQTKLKTQISEISERIERAQKAQPATLEEVQRGVAQEIFATKLTDLPKDHELVKTHATARQRQDNFLAYTSQKPAPKPLSSEALWAPFFPGDKQMGERKNNPYALEKLRKQMSNASEKEERDKLLTSIAKAAKEAEENKGGGGSQKPQPGTPSSSGASTPNKTP